MDRETLLRARDASFTTKRAGQGIGVGLSICDSIISGHGGKLDIESVPRRGTGIRIELPFGEAAA